MCLVPLGQAAEANEDSDNEDDAGEDIEPGCQRCGARVWVKGGRSDEHHGRVVGDIAVGSVGMPVQLPAKLVTQLHRVQQRRDDLDEVVVVSPLFAYDGPCFMLVLCVTYRVLVVVRCDNTEVCNQSTIHRLQIRTHTQRFVE